MVCTEYMETNTQQKSIGEKTKMNGQILFTDKEHSWTIPKIVFDFSGVTDPLPLERVVFSSKDEWSWLEPDEILTRTKDFEYNSPDMHEKFYKILETLYNMKTIHAMITLYTGHGSGMGTPSIDLSNEVKAIEMLKTWIMFANKLHELIGVKDKVEISDRLIIKIARETITTLFQMPNNERSYDDKKSVITQLSPYEDNDKVLKEKKLSINCKRPTNKIKKFLNDKEARW